MEKAGETTSLLQRIASGDLAAVDDCLESYGGLIWSLARKYCANNVDAEDATQDIFLELWKYASRYDPARSTEVTFVSMIARRRLIDRCRSGQAALQLVSWDANDEEVPTTHSTDTIELSDEADKAARCMEKLSDQQRNVLTLSIHESKPHASISQILKMPLGTVKSYARRGLLQLRECMERPANAEAN